MSGGKTTLGALQAWLDGPLDGADDLLVLLHGRGTDGGDLVDLGDALGWSGRVVALDAPNPWVEAGVGRVWYTNDAIMAGINESLTALESAFDALSACCPNARRPVLGGFSQGGVMTYEFGLRNPERFRGLVVMSGRIMPDSPLRQSLPAPESVPPLLVTHGALDPMVDVNDARDSQALLQSHGIDLRYVEDMSPHTISPHQAREIAEFLAKLGD